MSIKIKLKPIKRIFFNPSNGYKVLSCEPVGDYPNLTLNQYNNFTLAGTNLGMVDVGDEYELEIRENQRAKYPASYVLVGFADIDVSAEGIKITPEQELKILRHICDGNQPQYVHEAYPDFVQMVLDGREEEIDHKKIYNVGPVRFEEYVNKIKGYFTTIQFLPIASDWGIENDSDVSKLIDVFATPAELNQALESSPYHIFFDLLNYSFDKSDRYVLDKRPDLIDSKERCEFACLAILQENENEGDTRIYTDLLEELAEEKVPECAKYVKDAVRNSERIYYDVEQEYSSNKATYEAEVNIAENIKERLKAPNFFEDKVIPDFEKYRSIDGFNCTDEQMQILHELWNKNVAMLTGGAGVGKTSSMKAAIKMLEDNHIDYLLLAPTGIAMKRLKEATGRPALTIHMALACGVPKNFEGVVVIEESSMVSVHLLSNFLTEIGNKCKILFICDPAQLASISCGNIVQNIIDSGVVPISHLTKVFRYGTSGLATIATDTRNGELGPRQNSTFSDYQFIPINDKPIKQILDSYQTLLDNYNKDDIMILSPFNKGPVGTVAINKAIQSRYNPNPDTKAIRKSSSGEEIMFKIGDKVINTHNEYNMPCFLTDDDGSLVESTDRTISVMNGDIGYVRYIKETDRGIIMAVEFDTGMARIYGAYMNNLLLGYSISTHKSQGSESKAVIVITSSMHKRLLSSNLLYVADSRAKEQLIEIGDIETIKEGLKRHEQKERNTWLCELLKEE